MWGEKLMSYDDEFTYYDDDKSIDSESFSSFLAGILLTRKRIKNFEFLTIMSDFERKYGVNIVGRNELNIRININNDSIYLPSNYDDFIIINKKKIYVKDYLYSSTSDRIREYFDIPTITKNNNTVIPFVRKLIRDFGIKK